MTIDLEGLHHRSSPPSDDARPIHSPRDETRRNSSLKLSSTSQSLENILDDFKHNRLGQRVIYQVTSLTVLIYIMNLTPEIIDIGLDLPDELKTTSQQNMIITSALPIAATTLNFLMNPPNSDKRKAFIYSLGYSYFIEAIWQDPTAVYSMLMIFGISHYMNNKQRPRLHDLSKRLITTLGAATSAANDFVDKKFSYLMPRRSDSVAPEQDRRSSSNRSESPLDTSIEIDSSGNSII